MPDKKTIARAKRDEREGKSPGTQAGEFVREEMDHIREGKHGARSTQQAIAIGLSKARRAGVDLKAPAAGKASPETRRNAQRDRRKGQSAAAAKPPSATRSRAASKALQRESGAAASPAALSRQAKSAAAKRTAADRSKSAREAARTKGPAERSAAARKAARTRARET